MAWKCPECDSLNNDSIISCTCGYEAGMTTAPRLELLQTTAAKDTESKEIKVYKGGTPIEKFMGIIFFFLGIGLLSKLFHNAKDFTSVLIAMFFWLAYWYIIHSIIGRPCPSCKQWRAGEKQKKEWSQIFLKCKYCGHEWIIEEIDTMVGGG